MNRAETEIIYELNDFKTIEFNDSRVSFKDDEFIIIIKKEINF